ncbi:unnamed protein product, partial [Amoebophrya sp. A25]
LRSNFSSHEGSCYKQAFSLQVYQWRRAEQSVRVCHANAACFTRTTLAWRTTFNGTGAGVRSAWCRVPFSSPLENGHL